MNYQRFVGLVLFGVGIASGACPNAELTVLGFHPSLAGQTVVAAILLGLGAMLLSKRESLQ